MNFALGVLMMLLRRRLTVSRSGRLLPGSALCRRLPLTLSCLACLFFRSDEGSDEAVGHVLGSVLRYLVFLDEEYGVGVGVSTWHPLGKST